MPNEFCRNMKPFHISSILIPVLFAFFTPFSARDTITPAQPLADNETLISSGGQFALGFFTPTNSRRSYIGIWFNKMDQRIVWVANRASPVIYSPGLLSITANGTMVITDKKSSIIWSTDTSTGGLTFSVVQLLDDGNLVVREDSNNTQRYAWQSFDYPTDTLLAGMNLSLDQTTGFSSNLTAWKSDTDPSVGEYTFTQDTNSYMYIYSRSGKVWRNGQLDDIDLRNKGLNYSLVRDSQEVSFSIQASEPPTIFVITRSGKAQWLTWMPDLRQWNVSWEKPTGQCDIFGHCGPNGICNINTQPICNCFQGFVPKNPAKWASADWVDGCVRKTSLDCRNGTDVFAPISVAKLPDFLISFKNKDFSLDECRSKCLENCSCTAYGTYTWEVGCGIWVTNSLLDDAQIDGLQLDLYVRIASADLVLPTQSHKRKSETVIIVATLLSGLVLLIACVASFLWKRKRRKATSGASKLSSDKPDGSNIDLEFRLFDFATIETATNYFGDENILGRGGFGTVYKGKLHNEQEIAVKRLARTSLQGNDEFTNEVKVIAKLQNRNLVRLHGSCVQEEERMLIYEYMPNKSLDFFLFDKEKRATLDWQTRYKIIIGIARGLLYLHHDSRFRIIHRDLKVSNILLDKGMDPKISDFGMARFFGGDETDFRTRKVVGTYGYMSPEYAMGGIFSLKSDVFSFGVLILEIISGRKNSGSYNCSAFINLLAHAWSLWNEGKALELLDESMTTSFSTDDVLRCIKVGLLCVQEHPGDRPLMSSVILMLGADIIALPEPKQPGFVTVTCPLDWDQNANRQDPPTSNDLTITLEAR